MDKETIIFNVSQDNKLPIEGEECSLVGSLGIPTKYLVHEIISVETIKDNMWRKKHKKVTCLVTKVSKIKTPSK